MNNNISNQSNAFSIVAGGAGFIGVNLCERLLNEGRTVVVIDNLQRGSREYLSAFVATRDCISSKLTWRSARPLRPPSARVKVVVASFMQPTVEYCF